MIVRVYNFLSEEKPKFSQNLVGIVSDVTNFKYTRRAYDIGSFEMTIPTHADETECIQPDRMLIVGEKIKQTYIDGDPTKRIVVGTFLYVTDVEKKDDTITVTGYDLKYLFALRVTLFPKEEQDKGTYGYYVTSGTTFSCISDIINYNIVNTTDSDRQIYGMFGITMPVNQINADPPLTGIQDDRYMTRLEPVSTAIFNLLKNCKTHFYDMRLIIDDNAEDSDSYNPHMESSEDKPVIIIDESRYNIKSYTRKDGTSAYKNAIYAVVGSGDAVTVKCVKRPDDTASGVKRKEVVLDVDTDSVSEIDRYALKAAEEYVISDDFEIEPLFMDDETEPELAQKVSIRIDGVEYETVITEITDEYANGKHTQSYVCGDKKLKVLNVLNKATAGNTQKIVNNKIAAGTKEGVGRACGENGTSEIFNDYENNTAPSAQYAHAEGYKSTASGNYSHAGGKGCTASGGCSFAHGNECVASGSCSVALGSKNKAGNGSFVFGAGSLTGDSSIAFGDYNSAINNSFAFGYHLISDLGCFTVGKYNIENNYAIFAVGNGSERKRATALWLGRDGVLHVEGGITTGGGFDFSNSIASADTLGVVKVGNNLSISADGTLSAEAQPDIASASKAGIVKVGENIDVTADGTISIPAPCTLRIDNKASANLVHKYVPVTASEEKIYYGDIDNSIICNGYTFWRNGMTFSNQGIFVDFSPTLMIKKFAKTASGEIIEDCDFQVALVNVDSSIYAYKSYRLESKKAGLTTTSTYKHYSVQFDPIIFPTWKGIIAPTNNHPYGRLQVTLSLMYVNSSDKVATGNSISGYIDFATEAEYNAAVCLTHSSVRTTRMEERTNAFIIPSSISLVTDTLPETGEEDVLYLIYDKDTAPAMKEYLWHNSAWRYLGVTDVDLSEYLKSTDISDWAKAATKPSYTADEVGAAAKKHTHTKSDITDFPTLGTAAVKNTDYFAAAGHTHTAADVGAATAADITAAVNAVSIGGRNIITGTAEAVIGYGGHSKGHWRKYGTAGTIQTVDITDAPISCVSKGIRLASTDESSQIICGQDDIPLNSGIIYTFSCWIRSNSAEGVPCRLQPFYKSTTDHSGNTQDIIISDEWQYISFTAKFSPQSTGTYSGARIYLQPTAAGNYIEVCAMKLEAGNKPTDWSPASEDAERRITSLEARVAALEAAAVSGGEV